MKELALIWSLSISFLLPLQLISLITGVHSAVDAPDVGYYLDTQSSQQINTDFNAPTEFIGPVLTNAFAVSPGTCAELLIQNPTILSSGPFCKGELITIQVDAFNLPEGEPVKILIDQDAIFDPEAGEGVSIGMMNVSYSCSTCPDLLGIMVDPCRGTGVERENEFVIFHSGCGFSVSDLILDFHSNGNILDDDIGGGTNCNFKIPNASLISDLQAATSCAGMNILPATLGDVIPPATIVIIFTDANATSFSGSSYDLGLLGDTGLDVYILQNDCDRFSGAFANGSTMMGLRTTQIIVDACVDALTYDRFDLPVNIDPDSASVFIFDDAAGGYGIDYQLSCLSPDFSFIAWPQIQTDQLSLDYTISDALCTGVNASETYHVAGLLGGSGPCADEVSTDPNALQFVVMCPDPNVPPAGPFCYNAGDQTLTGTPLGGTWSGAGITDAVNGIFNPMVAGLDTHSITYTYTDPMMCTADSAIQIIVYGLPIVQADSAGPFCFTDPVQNLTGNQGSGTWAGAGTTPAGTFDPAVAGIGTHEITYAYTDGNMCTKEDTLNVVVENLPSVVIDPEGPFCSTDGSVTLSVTHSGDSGVWTGDVTAMGVFDPSVGPGTYEAIFTSTSAGGCVEDDTLTMLVLPALTLDTVVTHVACFGDATGEIDLSVMGGMAPFTYDWDNDGTGDIDDPQDLTGLVAGTYSVTVTDNNLCSQSITVIVKQPASALSIFVTGDGVSCVGESDGDVILSITGGTAFPCCPMYITDWDWDGTPMINDDFDGNGPTTDPEDLSGLEPGTYYVTVTDANGCTAVDSTVVSTNPSAIDNTTTIAPPLDCGGDMDGTIDLIVDPPFPVVGTYTYDWDWDGTPMINDDFDGNGATDDPQDLSMLGAGTYYVTVTNIFGCTITDSVTITEPDSLLVSAMADSLMCNGEMDADIISSVSGGNPPIDYDWSNDGIGDNDDTPNLSGMGGGTYTLIVTDANGCSSSTMVTVYEPMANAEGSESASICPGDSVLINSTWFSSAGLFQDTIFGGAANGCDSVINVTITLLPSPTGTELTFICQGDSILYDGTWYSSAGFYTDTLDNAAANGCDSIVTLIIAKYPVPMGADDGSYCPGDSVMVGTVWYSTDGIYQDTIENGSSEGCDSIVTVTITELAPGMGMDMGEFCPGDSVLVGSVWYSSAGSFMEIIPNGSSNGCDSIVTVTVTELSPGMGMDMGSYCPGDSVLVGGVYYSAAGTFMNTIPNGSSNGCDSIVTITITELPPAMGTDMGSFCPGDSVLVGGIWYSSSGTFMNTITGGAANGCDSIVTVTITELPPAMGTDSGSICMGDSIFIGGVWYTSAGTFMNTIVGGAANGCDSIVTITITEDPFVVGNDIGSFCAGDSVLVGTIWYPMAGTFQDTIVGGASNGCDSIVTITITEDPLLTDTKMAQICVGDSVQFYGIWIYSDTSYTDTVMGPGCDTVITITVTELPLLTDTKMAQICVGDSVQFYGIWIYSDTSYTDTVMGPGCDTVITITVTELPLLTDTKMAQICAGDSVQFYGAWIYSDTSYTDTVMGPGCDTVITITVTELPLLTDTKMAQICAGDSVQFYGTWIYSDTSYTDTVMGPGCDTVITITVTELPLLTDTKMAQICAGDSVQFYGTWIYSDTSYTDTAMGPGCDTVITITVTELPLLTDTKMAQICAGDSVQFYGIWIYSDTSYTDTVMGPGCDTVITITVTELPLLTDTKMAQICVGDSVQFYGIWIYSDTSYTDTVMGPGCDTVITITVTELPLLTDTKMAQICAGDSVQFYGTWIYSDTSYTDTVMGPGCDTVITITVTELPLLTDTKMAQICAGDSVQFYGTWIYSDTSYTDTVMGPGCDTVITITVTELPLLTDTKMAQICAGDSVQFYGTWIYSDTSYTDTVMGPGCDTIITITVTELPLLTDTKMAQICAGDSVQFYGIWIYSDTSYTDTVMGPGCDTIITITVTELPLLTDTKMAQICVGDSVQFYGTWIYSDTSYTDTVMGPGCDTVITITVTELPLLTDTKMAQICAGDSVQFYGTWIYSDTSYTDTVMGPGCDTVITITVTELPLLTDTKMAQICAGDSVQFYGTWIYSDTSYTDTVMGPGCDTVITITVTELPLLTDTKMAQICVGDSVQFYGTWIYSDTSYTDTVMGPGCDTVITITVTELPLLTDTKMAQICAGDSVQFYGTWIYSDTSYTDTVMGPGCDTVITITVTELPLLTDTKMAQICAGDSVQFYGTWIYSDTSYTDTAMGPGCDTIITITVTELPLLTDTKMAQICAGDSVQFYGVWIYSDTSYTDTVMGPGCDTIITIAVTELPLLTDSKMATICAGDSVQFYGTWYYTDTTFMDTAMGPGCDTIVTITITEDPLFTDSKMASVCVGDSVQFYGDWYFGDTTFTAISAGPGCDTLVTVTITEDPLLTLDKMASVCVGDSVQFYGTWYFEDTTFTAISAGPGCDTLVTVTITEDPLLTLDKMASICVGDSVQFYGDWYLGDTTFTTISAGPGCDTLVTVTIAEDPLLTLDTMASICVGDSAQFYGEWYYGDTTFTTISAGPGCDTLVTVTITEDPLLTLDKMASVCVGDSVQFYGTWYFGDTTFTAISAGPGCDTLVTVTITEDPLLTLDKMASVCVGDSVQFYGDWYFGDTTFTAISAGPGCDTLVTVTITEDPLLTLDKMASVCVGDSVQFYGDWYFGDTTFTAISAGPGCDTLVTVTIAEDPLLTLDKMASVCVGDSVQFYGDWYFGDTTFTTISVGPGCDTLVTVTITEDPLLTLDKMASICVGDSIQFYGIWYYGDTTFTTISAGPGCDTIVSVTVTEDPLLMDDKMATICIGDSVQFYGTWYYGDTTFTTLAIGPTCDTIVTVTITEDPPFTADKVASICVGDSVQFYGIWYYGDTTFTTISAGPGCDTIVSVTVTEDPLLMADKMATICIGDSVQFYGTWYYGDTTFTTLAIGPTCDTLVTVTITEDPPFTTDKVASICVGDSVQFYGIWYYGDTTFTTISAGPGCDTIVSVTVTEDPLLMADKMAAICIGDSVQFYGTWYYGDTTFTTLAIGPTCDTLVTVTITEDPPFTTDKVASICVGDSVQFYGIWYYGDTTFTTISAGPGCDTIVSVTVTEDPLLMDDKMATICIGDSVQFYGTWYYVDTSFTTLALGPTCDTLVTVTITEDPPFTADKVASICVGDSVQFYGIWYYGDTTFTTISAGPGCDTIVSVTVTEDPLLMADKMATICIGDSVQFYGTWYYGDTTFTTLAIGPTCDTLVTVTITEDPPFTADKMASICVGDSVQFYGIWYYGDTTFTTISAGPGCDTIVSVTVTEDPLLMADKMATICIGDSVQFYGTWYYVDTTFTTLALGPTCDTLITVTIAENPFLTDDKMATICIGDSVQFYGDWYFGDTTFTTISAGPGCDTVVTVNIQTTPMQDAVITPVDSICLSAGTQTLMASPGGGTWSGAVSSDQFDPAALGSGPHQVIYTVPGQCGGADTIIIEVYELIITCAQVQGESIPGANDGIGSVEVMGGSPVYMISWSGPTSGSTTLVMDGTANIANLPAGIYTITVVDANGCEATCQFTIDGGGCDLAIDTVLVSNVSCPGNMDGSLLITAMNGTPPYQYAVDDMVFVLTDFFDNLGAGNHTVFVMDAAGCVVSLEVSIGTDPAPVLTLDDETDPSCGADNGVIEVSGSGGQFPYTYQLDNNPPGASGVFSGLAAGSYTIYISDDNGCGDTIMVTLNAAGGPTIDDVVIVDAMCGQSNGQITIIASGGTGTLMYEITGFPQQTSPIFPGLPAGSYTVIVTDENDCFASQQVNIADLGGPTIDDIVSTETACGDATGTITITASGGTDPLEYSIDCINFQPSNVFDNLGSGLYNICVRDASGCMATSTHVVGTTDGPIIDQINLTQTSCGEENGVIEIIASGGTGQLVYSIGDGFVSDNLFENLMPGMYTITVQDENMCEIVDVVNIGPSIGPEMDIYLDNPEHCDDEDGTIEIDAVEGLGPFQYSIDGGASWSGGFFFGNLSADLYTVCLRDAQGCIVCEDVFVDDWSGPTIDDVIVENPDCGESNGSITILTSSFGILEYSINGTFWQDTNYFFPVSPGTYTVYVSDQFNCEATEQVVLADALAPVIDSLIITPGECGVVQGSILIEASGGFGELMYSLDNITFFSNPLFTGLDPGNYAVYVKDENDCLTAQNAVVPGSSSATFEMDTSVCLGGSVLIAGTELSTQGLHEITLAGQASNGCDSIITVNLTILLPADEMFDVSLCQGDTAFINGKSYFNTGVFEETLSGQAANGCDSILTINVMVSNGPDAMAGTDQTIDCDAFEVTLDGSATIADSLIWEGPDVPVGEENNPTILVAIPGQYILFAFDELGCPNSDTVIVNIDPTIPLADAGPDFYISCDIDEVQLQGNVMGSNVEYLWNGPGITNANQNISNPIVTAPGWYTLTAVDTIKNCTSPPDSVFVDDLRYEVFAIIQNAGSLNCFTTSLEIDGTGSTNGINVIYIWEDSLGQLISSSPIIEIDSAGTYTFHVIDTLSGCFDTDIVNIEDLTEYPPADAGLDQELNCNSDFVTLNEGGSITQQNVVVSWTTLNGVIISDTSLAEIDVSTPGTYIMTLVDTLNGCTNSDTVNVIDNLNAPVAEAGPDQMFNCNTSSIFLNPLGSSTGDSITYLWTGPGLISDPSGQVAEVVDVGMYYLTVLNDNNGCVAIDSVEIVYNENVPSSAFLEVDDPNCFGYDDGSITILSVNGGTGPYQYSLDGILFYNEASFLTLTSGEYNLIVRDTFGCEWDTVVTLVDPIILTVDIDPSIELSLGEEMQLFAEVNISIGDIDSIIWTPGDHLSCNNCLNPIITGFETGLISVTVVSEAGCMAEDFIFIDVDLEGTIYIPNAFSPNDDQKNDGFTVFADESVLQVNKMQIFNRWGDKIFENKDFPPNETDLGWDGSFRGQMLEPGVFVYVVEIQYIDGRTKILSGDLTLVR